MAHVTLRRCPLCRGLVRQADRLAQRIQTELGVPCAIARGRWGEFSVLVDERVVVRKRWLGTLSDDDVVSTVRIALAPPEAAAAGDGMPRGPGAAAHLRAGTSGG